MRKLLTSPFFVSNSSGSSSSLPQFPLVSGSSFSPPSNFSYTFPLSNQSIKPTFLFPSVPVSVSALDFTTLGFISGLLILSLLSFSFIFHLRIRSRQFPHLQNFNSLWTVRILLVFFAFLWSFNEIFRLHFIRRKSLFPLLSALTLDQQSDLCKIHVVLSLGLFEPGFLITLLFLVHVSVKKQSPSGIWAFIIIWPICIPIAVVQALFVFFSPLQEHLPKYMHESSFISRDDSGNDTVLCTYPLYSGILFGGFTIAYSSIFLFSCWRVMSFVINKKIHVRVNVLAMSFLIALPVQVLCLVMLPIWPAENPIHGVALLVMFLAVAWCVAVGEVTLVIKPIADAFAAGRGCSCVMNPGITLGRPNCDGGRMEERSL